MLRSIFVLLYLFISWGYSKDTLVSSSNRDSVQLNEAVPAIQSKSDTLKKVPNKSADKLFVGMAKFSGEGLTAVELQAVTSKFQDEMLAINKVQLMEQAQMDALLTEKGLQASGCLRSTCLVEMGTTLGVEQMVFGTINKVGDVFTIVVKMVDVETGKTVKSTMFDTDDELPEILKTHLRTLAENILGKANPNEGTYTFDQTISQKTAAVLEIEAAGLSETEKRGLTERLRAELFNTGKLEVMEREMMNMILQEQDFQQSDMCNSEGCLVKVGQLVGVDYMVGGSVARIGDLYSVSVRMIDVGTGKIVRTASTETRGSLEDVLKNSTNDVARSLVGLKMRERTNVVAWSWLGASAFFGVSSLSFVYLERDVDSQYDRTNDSPSKVKELGDKRDRYWYAALGTGISAGLCAALSAYKFLTFGDEVKVQTIAVITPKSSQLQVAVGF